MATQVTGLVRTSVDDDGSYSYWEDQVEYGVGTVPARDTVAVALTAYKVDEDLVETALTAESDDDPEDADAFSTENGVDGYHKYYYLIAPRWLISTEYNQYDIVWSEDEEAWYQYINETSSDGNDVTDETYFEVIEDPTTTIANIGTDEEPGNIFYQVVGKVVTFQTSICNLKAHSQFAKEHCDCGCDDPGDCGCDSKLGRLKDKIRNLFATMYFNEVQEQWVEGEKNARLAERYCDECGCLSR